MTDWKERAEAADQPAQCGRLDDMADLSQERLLADAYARGQADMRERAAQVADNEAREAKKLGEPGWGSFEHLACRIRNLRDGGDT